jgi:hypothetical protein
VIEYSSGWLPAFVGMTVRLWLPVFAGATVGDVIPAQAGIQ